MIGGTFTARRSTSLLAVGCKKESCKIIYNASNSIPREGKKYNLRSNVTVTDISKVPRHSHTIFKLEAGTSLRH
jgi:hypothetical protein